MQMYYKTKALAYFLILIGICLGFSVYAGAIGLEVNPGEISVQNCPLARVVRVSELAGEGARLQIQNKSASAYTYEINILPVSATTSSLKAGYTDILDISWIQPEEKEVTVEAKSTKAVDIFLNIPQNEEYTGRNFQAVIEVKTKKNQSEEIFVLACQLNIYIACAD